MRIRYALCLTLCACVSTMFAAEKKQFDWPQWQGPTRDAISRETGLLSSWPKGGPKLLWKTMGLGGGYSGSSVAAGRIYGMSYRGDDEVVWALDEGTGREIWSTRIAGANHRIAQPGEEGSRCTPTVDGDVMYILGVSGDILCLDTVNGSEKWHHNLVKDFGGNIPSWGYSESPLVDGDKVVVTPGGQATMVALDKKSGDTVWKGKVPDGNGAVYSSVITGDVAGQKQYIQMLNGGLVGFSADDGKLQWRYKAPGHGISCSTPVYHDNLVFGATGYGVGGGLAKLTRAGSTTDAKEVYFTKHMKNHHGGMVLVKGYLYGANDPGMLTCLEYTTGKVMWEERKPGKGSITYADGRLYYRNEGGPIILVEANHNKYVEHGRFEQPDKSGKANWPHPVIANGRMYIRDQDVLLCYDIKKR